MTHDTIGEPQRPRANRTLILKRSSTFLGLVAAIWFLLFQLDRTLFFIRPGADAIYEVKLHHLRNEIVLPSDPVYPVRVIMFGNSRTLAGFRPAVFDDAIGLQCRSYNAGLPDSQHFVAILDELLASGNRPTHVLVQVPWAGADADLRPREWLQQDERHISTLFPFRKFPRNLVLFTFLSRRHGGPLAAYQYCRNETLQMLDQRGYYFIAGQSHFPDNRLPPDYSLPTDAPDELHPSRAVSTTSRSFVRLAELAKKYDFQVYVVPDHMRMAAFAEPPPEDSAAVESLSGHERFYAIGPAYWRYPNRFFADAVHLNEEGADKYTRQLAELLRPELRFE
ncbi:MAG: hypothetical protein ABI619_07690 [Betaproteobacteria bacterium]